MCACCCHFGGPGNRYPGAAEDSPATCGFFSVGGTAAWQDHCAAFREGAEQVTNDSSADPILAPIGHAEQGIAFRTDADLADYMRRCIDDPKLDSNGFGRCIQLNRWVWSLKLLQKDCQSGRNRNRDDRTNYSKKCATDE